MLYGLPCFIVVLHVVACSVHNLLYEVLYMFVCGCCYGYLCCVCVVVCCLCVLCVVVWLRVVVVCLCVCAVCVNSCVSHGLCVVLVWFVCVCACMCLCVCVRE